MHKMSVERSSKILFEEMLLSSGELREFKQGLSSIARDLLDKFKLQMQNDTISIETHADTYNKLVNAFVKLDSTRLARFDRLFDKKEIKIPESAEVVDSEESSIEEDMKDQEAARRAEKALAVLAPKVYEQQSSAK